MSNILDLGRSNVNRLDGVFSLVLSLRRRAQSAGRAMLPMPLTDSVRSVYLFLSVVQVAKICCSLGVL